MRAFFANLKKNIRLLKITAVLFISITGDGFAHLIPKASSPIEQSSAQLPDRPSTNPALINTAFSQISLQMKSQGKAVSTKNIGKQNRLNPPETAGVDPVIVIDNPYNAGVFEAAVGTFEEQFYFVGGSGFTPGEVVSIELAVTNASPFTISTETSGYGKSLIITKTAQENGTLGESVGIAIKYEPLDSGPHNATISHSSTNTLSQTLNLDGNISSTPVKWLSFNARTEKDEILLEWTTASEQDNSHFEIEVSKNPKAGFQKTGSLKSKAGNSNTPVSYSFKHPKKGNIGTLYFRLKQVDIDNTSSYSRTIAVALPSSMQAEISLAPNPIGDQAKLNMLVSEAGSLRMVIFDNKGVVVYSGSQPVAEGNNELHLPGLTAFPAGIYYLITEFKGESSRLRFVKL